MNRFKRNRLIALQICFENYSRFLAEFIEKINREQQLSGNVISFEAGKFTMINCELRIWLCRFCQEPYNDQTLKQVSTKQLKQISCRLIPLVSSWMSANRLADNYLLFAQRLGSFFRLEHCWHQLWWTESGSQRQNW